MTITIPADKIVTLIKQTCDAHLPAIERLQEQVEARRKQASEEKQALGNYNIDALSVAMANQGALAALGWIKIIVDGIVDFKPVPGQPE